MRTGAATGIATKHMARKDSSVLGLFGAGWQAQTQALAVSEVRSLSRILVYSRSPEKRREFAEQLGGLVSAKVVAADSPEQIMAEADIVVTATTSKTPVFDGSLLRPGTHVNAVGSNSLAKAEVDVTAVSRADQSYCGLD